MHKLAIVVQRCHETIVGGSEALAWEYATLLRERYHVEILTSTARDYMTWANDLPEGVEERDGIAIRRFPVTITRSAYWHQLHADWQRSAQGAAPAWRISLEEEFIRHQGPYCCGLLEHLQAHGNEYAEILLLTYLYPTTYFAMKVLPRGRCVLVPTLHDEPTAYLRAFKLMANRAREIFFLTHAEQRLAEKLWGKLPGRVVAMPVETTLVTPILGLPPFLFYCGRIDASKGCDQLLEFFLRWKQQHPSKLQLVLAGEDKMGLPRHPDIVYRGFVPAQEKYALMAAARAFVMPSAWESFSIATLEAMSQGTPALVNGLCEVLADHVQQSGVGKTYHDYESFCAGLCELTQEAPDLQATGNQARNYVLSRYQASRVREVLFAAMDATYADMAPDEPRLTVPA